MKVNYQLKSTVSLQEVKELIKPYGGRCAKISDNMLEFQIKEEKAQEAAQELKEKGYI